MNLMLDMPNLDSDDLMFISWWLEGHYMHNVKIDIARIMLTDKDELKQKAHRHFNKYFSWDQTITKGTYRKLFGEYQGNQ